MENLSVPKPYFLGSSRLNKCIECNNYSFLLDCIVFLSIQQYYEIFVLLYYIVKPNEMSFSRNRNLPKNLIHLLLISLANYKSLQGPPSTAKTKFVSNYTDHQRVEAAASMSARPHELCALAQNSSSFISGLRRNNFRCESIIYHPFA